MIHAQQIQQQNTSCVSPATIFLVQKLRGLDLVRFRIMERCCIRHTVEGSDIAGHQTRTLEYEA